MWVQPDGETSLGGGAPRNVSRDAYAGLMENYKQCKR
jgi:hypothetical protein